MGYKAAVIGASGFAGAELVRLLSQHPSFELVCAVSDSLSGEPVSKAYPALAGAGRALDAAASAGAAVASGAAGMGDAAVASDAAGGDDANGASGNASSRPAAELTFVSRDDESLKSVDVAFLAVPHTASLGMAPALMEAGVSVIDLSADFRLRDPAVYERYYGTPHTQPELLAKSFFGLPELERESIQAARAAHQRGESVLVACAGCYPTASSLAIAPAVRMQAALRGATVIVDAISGITGAGRTPTARTHFCAANGNLSAYGLLEHRHTPEMEQIMGNGGGVLFTPHLAPLNRGLLSTVTVSANPSADGLSTAQLIEAYADFYKDSPFVRVLPEGEMPQTSAVVGTNNAQVSISYSERTNMVLGICAIDNLCKGAAGQAVQCANIVFGLDEAAGLAACALPV